MKKQRHDAKPGGRDAYESYADTKIREAMAAGEFDDLPGAGKPLPDLDAPYDELWWVKEKLRREGVGYLPPALEARSEIERRMERLKTLKDEARVRAELRAINERIAALNRSHVEGPGCGLALLDEEDAVARWRDRSGE